MILALRTTCLVTLLGRSQPKEEKAKINLSVLRTGLAMRAGET